MCVAKRASTTVVDAHECNLVFFVRVPNEIVKARTRDGQALRTPGLAVLKEVRFAHVRLYRYGGFFADLDMDQCPGMDKSLIKIKDH